MSLIKILFLWATIEMPSAKCFLPNDQAELLASGAAGSLNHYEITKMAINEAGIVFLKRNKNLYPNDQSYYLNLTTFSQVKRIIARENGDVDLNLITGYDPIYHFDDEEFTDSNNNIIRQRKLTINLIDQTNLDEARKRLGSLLHTLQDFYSHSNYIEMKYTSPFKDLGVLQSIFNTLTIADPSEDTCSDCNNTDGCDNNIIITTKLTSGYYDSLNMNNKPNGHSPQKGKCSHGGPMDETRRKAPRGGINKDSLSQKYSPHYLNHSAAAKMSLEASKVFIVGLFDLGQSKNWTLKFGSFLGFYPQDNKFCYVVNVAKLAIDEIRTIKQKIINSIAKGTKTVFDQFVLSKLEGGIIKTFATGVYSEAIRAIQSLDNKIEASKENKVLTAIETTLSAVSSSSICNIFSDSSAPTDGNLFSSVLALASSQDITINTFISVTLPVRKKRSVTTTDNLLKKLSLATGGNSISYQSTDVSEVLNSLEKQTYEGKVTITEINNQQLLTTKFAVDSSITKLEFVILSSLINGFQLFNPKGQLVNILTYLTSTSETKIFELDSPIVGMWTITVNSSTYSLRVNGFSGINFDYMFSGLNNEPIKGRLISNKTYFADFNGDQSVLVRTASLLLLSETGSTISSNLANGSNNAFRAQVEAPNEAFRLKVIGQSENQETIERIISGLLMPASINVTLKYNTGTSGYVASGSSIELTSVTINEGPTGMFSIKIANSKSWASSELVQNVSLIQGISLSLVHRFTAPSTVVSGDVSNVILSVESIDGNVENVITLPIIVYNPISDSDSPTCTIKRYSPNADACRGLNTPTTCSSKSYTVFLEAQDAGSGLSSFRPQEYIEGAVFKSAEYTVGTKNIVPSNYTLTCCNPSVIVVTSDLNANVNHCQVNMDLSPLPVVSLASGIFLSGKWISLVMAIRIFLWSVL